MRPCFLLLPLAAALLLVAGCNKSAGSVVDKQLALMNEMADLMEKDAPEADMQALNKRIEALNADLKAMNLTPEEMAKLIKDKQPEFMKVAARIQQATMKKMGGLLDQMKDKMPGGLPGVMPTLPGMPK